MKIQEIRFAVTTNNKEITKVGRSVIYQPSVNYKGKGTKWFDDSRLIAKGGAV